MDSLKGKTILIGKEPGQGRLEIAVLGGSQPIVFYVGSPGSVPNTVSRCKPGENVAHAKITVDGNGAMILSNIKPQNVTWVNGSEIESKRIMPSSAIALGPEQYKIDINAILEMAAKAMVQSPVTEGNPSQTKTQTKEIKKYNIRHLERVWDKYHDGLIEIQKRGTNKGVMARLPMVFTMTGGTLTAISFGSEWSESIKVICIVFTAIALALMIHSLVSAKKDTSIDDRERLNEEFQEHYCCPNPECNKFLGNMSYKLMKKQTGMKCPSCKSEFIEK